MKTMLMATRVPPKIAPPVSRRRIVEPWSAVRGIVCCMYVREEPAAAARAKAFLGVAALTRAEVAEGEDRAMKKAGEGLLEKARRVVFVTCGSLEAMRAGPCRSVIEKDMMAVW